MEDGLSLNSTSATSDTDTVPPFPVVISMFFTCSTVRYMPSGYSALTLTSFPSMVRVAISVPSSICFTCCPMEAAVSPSAEAAT